MLVDGVLVDVQPVLGVRWAEAKNKIMTTCV